RDQARERERSVVRAFLRALGARFDESELANPDADPPDVTFRTAQFEVVESLREDRARGDEWKETLKKRREAKSIADLMTTYRPRPPLELPDILPAIAETAQRKFVRYGMSTARQIDLLVYVNREATLRTTTTSAFTPDLLGAWRSVSFLCAPVAVV